MSDTGKVIACLKELGFEPKIRDFENRLIIQKTVYLLQLMGIKTGFSYGFYVRGPYSPDLTKEIYGKEHDFENLKTNTELSRSEKKIISEFKEKLEMKAGLLEVVATYAHFVNVGYNTTDAISWLKKTKPFFSETQTAVGISRAKLLFPPTEKEIAEMKEEFSAWEEAIDSDNS